MHARTLCAVATLVAAASGAAGQIVLPAGTDGNVTLAHVDELVVYHKQREELIVQCAVEAADDAPDFSRLALVMPVPAAAVGSVAFEDSAVISEMRSYFRRGLDESTPPEIAGGYELNVIAGGKDQLPSDALNDWLNLNGLNTIDRARLDYYDENGWSFVVERVHRTSFRGIASLKPIRISFESVQVTFPVRLMLQGRPLTASFFLITKDLFDASQLEDYGFSVRFEPSDSARLKLKLLPEPVEALVGKLGRSSTVFKDLRSGHIHACAASASFDALDTNRPEWRGELQLAGPHISGYRVTTTILALAASIAAVVLISRPRKKAQP